MKILHHDDADGRSAAYIVAEKENNFNKDDFIESDYVKEIPYKKISKDEKLYIVDFSFTETTLKRLKKLMSITKNIIWIDHHASSIALINKHPELNSIKGIRKVGISGVGLAYMYLNSVYSIEDCPLFVQLISDFDCFHLKMKDSENFILGLQSNDYSPTSDIWKQLYSQRYCEELIADGELIKRYNIQEYKDYLDKYSYESEIEGYKALVINRRAYSAIFGDKYNQYDICCSFIYSNGVYTYSIFTSKKNIDCSKIAEKYGGGGHPGSAGFSTKQLILKKREEK